MVLKSIITSSGSGGGSVSPFIVGPTGNYSTIQAAINAAVLAGASASSPATLFIQNGTYPETATSNIITLATGVNLTALDQLYNGIVFDAQNNSQQFNFDGGVEIQAKFVFTRTSGHCYSNISNVFINSPTSSNILESPAGVVFNNCLISLNSGCTFIHTTPATLGAAGRSDVSLNNTLVRPDANTATRRAVVMLATTVANTLRITMTNSAIYDVSGSTLGTGSSNSLNNNLEIFGSSGSSWNSTITSSDGTSRPVLQLAGCSYGKDWANQTGKSNFFVDVLRGLFFTSDCQNWFANTWVGLDNTNTWNITIDNDVCYQDTYLWDFRPANFKLFNVQTNTGLLNTGPSSPSSGVPTLYTVSSTTTQFTTTNSPTTIGNITIPENSSIAINGIIQGAKNDGTIITGFTYSLICRRSTGADVTISTDPVVNTFPTAGGEVATLELLANTTSGQEGLKVEVTPDTGTWYWQNSFQYNLNMVQ